MRLQRSDDPSRAAHNRDAGSSPAVYACTHAQPPVDANGHTNSHRDHDGDAGRNSLLHALADYHRSTGPHTDACADLYSPTNAHTNQNADGNSSAGSRPITLTHPRAHCLDSADTAGALHCQRGCQYRHLRGGRRLFWSLLPALGRGALPSGPSAAH